MAELLEKDGQVREHIAFIDEENLLAVYYPEIQFMHFVWKKRTVGEPYRKAFMDAVEFSKTNKTKYFLSDIRDQGIVGPDDRKWFESTALPAAIEQGMQRTGLVFDGNVFKMHYINMILKHVVNKGIPMKFFKELAPAVDWLLSE